MRQFCIAVFALMLSALSVQAQETPFSGDWSNRFSLYGWVPGIKGDQTFPDGDPLIDLSSSDVLDALNGAFFGSAEFRNGRFGLIFDLAYADLGQDGAARGTIIPGQDPANASVDTTLWLGTAALAYRTFEEDGKWVDVYGGLRYYDVSADFTFKIPSIGFKSSLSEDSSWFDAIVGLRGHVPLGEKYSVTGLVDVGGFGIGDSSNLSWEAIATLDYAFTDNVTGRLGYRYMSIDKDGDRLDLDLKLGGPLIGVTWNF
ncbi:outer membrane protein [Tateyamaria pelophila]|uniref:outer membrane protein n=1 Tax=Tateyamaria pelophila TaxID=328415 RepID=UPI001CC0FCB7|nr:hypothetical protein [Tateyamaria pelophila]